MPCQTRSLIPTPPYWPGPPAVRRFAAIHSATNQLPCFEPFPYDVILIVMVQMSSQQILPHCTQREQDEQEVSCLDRLYYQILAT